MPVWFGERCYQPAHAVRFTEGQIVCVLDVKGGHFTQGLYQVLHVGHGGNPLCECVDQQRPNRWLFEDLVAVRWPREEGPGRAVPPQEFPGQGKPGTGPCDGEP